MIEIVKAIKTRFTAKSLGDSITGGIHHTEYPPGTSYPVAVFTEIGHAITERTITHRYAEFRVQFDVYTNDGDPETSADLAQSLKDAMEHSDRASSNALSIPSSDGGVINFESTSLPRNIRESDDVWRTMFEMKVNWAESRTLRPA